MKYEERTYRNKIFNQELKSYRVTVRETDLFILSDYILNDLAIHSIYKYRSHIESYIRYCPQFLTSLIPLKQDDLSPIIVREMLKAADVAKVGPMAAVAGAIAEFVGWDILNESKNVIIENGGDIFIKTEKEIKIGVFAGESPLSFKVRILVRPDQMPIGVCTSSGTVGHSLSFGRADAVCVLSKSAAIADAAATYIGNLVKTKHDIKNALERGFDIDEVLGILIIVGDQMGVNGNVELV